MEWLLTNSNEVMALVGATGVIVGIVVKLTPTKVDDEWWQAIKGLLRRR
jgi:hypothetical protein